MAAVECLRKTIRFILPFFTGDLFIFFQRANRLSEWFIGNCVFVIYSQGVLHSYQISWSPSCLVGLGSLIIDTVSTSSVVSTLLD